MIMIATICCGAPLPVGTKPCPTCAFAVVCFAGIALGVMLTAVVVRHSPRIVKWLRGRYAVSGSIPLPAAWLLINQPERDLYSTIDQLELYLWQRREVTDGRYPLPVSSSVPKSSYRYGGR
jgi:hypothetical protein